MPPVLAHPVHQQQQQQVFTTTQQAGASVVQVGGVQIIQGGAGLAPVVQLMTPAPAAGGQVQVVHVASQGHETKSSDAYTRPVSYGCCAGWSTGSGF